MKNYNPNTPVLFLNGTVSSTSIILRYEYNDETNLGPSGFNIPIVTEITVTGIDPQEIGDFSSRAGGEYTAIDIKTGDWVADSEGRICLEIINISEKSNSSIKFTAKDVDAYSYKNFKTNIFSSSDKICFFETSDSGKALITGNTTFFTSRDAIDKIQTKFIVSEESERFRIEFSQPQAAVSPGDVVTIDSNGDLIPFGTAGAASYKIGILSDLSYGSSIAYVKPFNKIIDNFSAPERLTGTAGQIYYSSTANPGELVTDSTLGESRIFFQIRDAIPTVVQATTADVSMTTGDSLIINNETIFEPLGADVTKTATEVRDAINIDTATHKVAATVVIPAAKLESDAVKTANGDVVLVTSTDGGATTVFPSATFSDGTNSTTVTFNTADGTFPTNSQLITISATQIAQDLNAAFESDSVDLTAETFVIEGTNNPSVYPGLRIIAGTGSSVEITNGTADAATQTYTAATGIIDGFPPGVIAPVATEEFLTLTRTDGGDILIQGVGSFVNQNGIVSSSAGSPALLLMIEDEEGTTETGVSTADDLDWEPANTSADGDYAGIAITYTPYNDSNVQVTVNGLGVNLGNGIKTKDCYFSGDDGVTARAIADIEAGDELYWNGSIAGYQLETSDLVDIIYDASSNDV